MSENFYTDLPLQDDFGALADPSHYEPVPDDWWVGVSDIVGSTEAISAGQYKTVNMVGAAVISAQINAHGGLEFPFIFGGDGAGFAVPPGWHDTASNALAAVKVWALDEFEMKLRVALVRVGEIREAGQDVRVARYAVQGGANYAMFAGGGLSWAETRMKAGQFDIPAAPNGSLPDLTGLSCRWSHMPSQNGQVVSLVIDPAPDAASDALSTLYNQVLSISQQLERSGHPAPKAGPGTDWPPKGTTLEAHAQRGAGSLGKARRKALFESLLAWVLIKTGIKVGGFDARRYQRVVGQNADYRKFDDGLKMTLDCDPKTEADLVAVLDRAMENGLIRYGLHRQSEAMMTCIVPSILTDDHVHFVDGAAGGYTAAATSLKSAS